MNNSRLKWSLIVGLAAMTISAGAAAQITGELVNPNVMLVVDSSGSMDWLQGHPISAGASWQEAGAACAAQDANQRTAWQKLLDVLLGSIPADEYHCMTESPEIRPALADDTVQSDVLENISEYRESPHSHYRAVPCETDDWNTDYQQCIGNTLDPADGAVHGDIWCLDADWDTVNNVCYDYHPLARSRRTNGILERYSSLVRFGLMTYDNKPAPAASGVDTLADPHEGLWDYGVSRSWRCKEWYYGEMAGDLSDYPACTWNAGTRTNDPNAVGRLVPISDDVAASNQAMRSSLAATEPLYCSPMGSLLDDVGYYFHNHPDVLPSGEGGNDRYFWCRPKLVIFISDGQPTPAFEFPQDYCDVDSEAPPGPKEAISPSTIYRCPWNSSNTEAAELFSLVDPADADPVLLVVIGFNVPSVDCDTDPDECVQVTTTGDLVTPSAFLDQLAFTGWPNVPNVEPPPWRPPFEDTFSVGDDPDDNCPTSVCGSGGALFVETPEQLSAVLDMVLGALTTTTVTRTEVTTTDQTSNALSLSSFSSKTVAQYEFNSGYLTQAGLPWKGLLYRQGFECESSDGDDPAPLHEWLNGQTTRHLYTLPTGLSVDGNTIPKEGDYPASIKDQPEGLDILVELDDVSELSDCDFGGPLLPDPAPDPYQLCSASNDIQTEVVKHMYGLTGSERQHHKLADIYNSTPVVLGPPMERLLVPSYQAFKSEQLPGETDKRMIERPPYLFVGTNDGVVHSINIWAEDGDDVETWGYVPSPLLETVKDQYPISWTMNEDGGGNYISYTLSTNSQYQHIFGVDGTPVATDVRLYRSAAGMDEQTEADLWRSIVMGSLGKGGRGYYCLDVINPSQPPTYRWEVSPDSAGNNPPGPADNPEDPTADPHNPQTFDGMGVPISRPALAYAYYEEAIPG
ncbi:MAG: hypothetical protein JRF63_06170, partial [Deltaproteobacteria bacterium]|nr:hypothetical protein [Deltaproteobacteria bacterium]